MAATQAPLVAVETDAQGVRTLTIALPDRPVAVLTPPLRAALIDAFDAALADPAVRGVVIAGSGPAFLAGADLTALGTMRGRQPTEVRAVFSPFRAMLRRMERGGKPVVAAINGTALGGGYELCLACHHRIAADIPDSLIGLPEVTLGLLPGAGGTQRLARLIGIAKAMPLLLDGTRLSPARALAGGLVDAVVAPGDLIAAAKAWIATGPDPVQPWDRRGFAVPGGGPGEGGNHRLFIETGARTQAGPGLNDPAPQAILSCLFEGLRVPFDDGLAIEGRLFAHLARGGVAQNRIRAFFSMGAAKKAAARPQAPRFAPRRLGILGAGMMGRGLAEVAALNGLDVVLLDRDAEAAEAGHAAVAASLRRAQVRGRVTAEAAAAALDRIAPTAVMADLAGCDALIEAVYEDRAVKAEVTRAALAATGPDALFASNTSKLPITGLAGASPAPERFIGMHFFSPVPRMALVEIILGDRTAPVANAQALDLARALGKTPIVVRDGRGFFTSRVFSTYLAEGIAMLTEGVTPALIENAGRQAGMPLGPLAMADEISQETMLRIREQERADLGAAWRPGPEYAAVARMVEIGRTGRRAAAGFHDFLAEGERRLWSGLTELFPSAPSQPEPAEVRARLLVAQAVEAARAWAEGLIEDPRMADVGSLLGWSFPGWTGGVMSFIDQGGLAAFVAKADRLAETHGPRFAVPDRLRALADAGGSLYG